MIFILVSAKGRTNISVLCGSLNPGLDLKVSRGHGLGTPPWYRSIPDGTNIYQAFKTRLNRTYDKSLMEQNINYKIPGNFLHKRDFKM